MNPQDLKPNVVRGAMFPEPVKIIRVVPMGGSSKSDSGGERVIVPTAPLQCGDRKTRFAKPGDEGLSNDTANSHSAI